jgi:hypothetical protein
MGCCDAFSLEPGAGSAARGALICTPAMGPAIEGLRGFSLFSTPHPAAPASKTMADRAVRFERKGTMVTSRFLRPSRAGVADKNRRNA